MQIHVNGVSFSYDRERNIFRDIGFTVNAGEIISILGPNGIGKTTLLSCLAKLKLPTAGNIILDGQDMKQLSHREVARLVGYVPQSLVPSFDYSVLDYVVTGLAPWLGTFEKPQENHYHEAIEALKKMGIAHLQDKAYSRISAGELQQVSIARVIAQRVRFILMDEPTAHLDYGNQLKVLRIVQTMADEGYGIVMTTHNPDQVLLLGGKVAIFDTESRFHYGRWDEILSDSLLESIYGVKLQICEIDNVKRKVCIAPSINK